MPGILQFIKDRARAQRQRIVLPEGGDLRILRAAALITADRLADVILLDTPPVLVVPDTAIIGSFTRGAVVVASEGKTDRDELERTVHRLESTNCSVLGVALNRVRRASASSYQAYAYKQ